MFNFKHMSNSINFNGATHGLSTVMDGGQNTQKL